MSSVVFVCLSAVSELLRSECSFDRRQVGSFQMWCNCPFNFTCNIRYNRKLSKRIVFIHRQTENQVVCFFLWCHWSTGRDLNHSRPITAVLPNLGGGTSVQGRRRIYSTQFKRHYQMLLKNYSDETRNETSDQFNVSQLYLLSWFVNEKQNISYHIYCLNLKQI